MPQFFKPLISFAQKLSNDWILNLAGLLAFNLLMASVPFLLVLLALLGITFGLLSPPLEREVILNISAVFPSQAGETLIHSATSNLARSAGLLLILGLISSVFLGSRLFIVIENCFGIIFRVRSRDLVPQNLIALGMMLLFSLLVPLFLTLSIVPAALLSLIHPSSLKDIASTFTQGLLFLITLIVAIALFGLIYWIVPNRPTPLRSVWPGTLLAAALLLLYEKIFPWYTQTFLRPSNQGSLVGFAIVILIFYNYLAFILLLGAELNSWIAGKRGTAGDLQAIITQADEHEAELAALVPAAVHPVELQTAPAPETKKRKHPIPHENVPPYVYSDIQAINVAPIPKGRKAVIPLLRERRYGRSILAGQIAAASVIVASLLVWLIQTLKKGKHSKVEPR